VDGNRDKYILQAGSVVGIIKRPGFSLYREKDRDGTPLGNVITLTIITDSSLIQPFLSLDTSSPIYAVQATFANVDPLRVYLDSDPCLNRVREKLKEAIEMTPYLYTILDSPKKAQLEVGIQNDTATFTLQPALLDKENLGQLPYRVSLKEVDKIFNAINAASMFNRYLSIHPPEPERAKENLQDLVQIDLLQLEIRDNK
jgi:hypothetical protein